MASSLHPIMITEIFNNTQFLEILNSEQAVLFKHSTSCTVSSFAYREVVAFAKSHPDIPFFMVLVIEQRNLSNAISEYFHIRHESPQVIVIIQGRAVAHFSHGQITASKLEETI